VRQGFDRPLVLRSFVDRCDRCADLDVSQGTEPSGPCCRITLDPGADRLQHQHITQAAHHGIAAGANEPGLLGEQLQSGSKPVGPNRPHRLEVDDGWERLDEMTGRWVVEAHAPAHERRHVATPAVAQHRVGVGLVLVRQVEHGAHRYPLATPPTMARSLGDEYEIARSETDLVDAVDGDRALAGDDHVEPQAVHRR
jgi:hypothetical protein